MSSIVVSNLPTLLFSQHSDIEPLFLPFGDVKKIEHLPTSPGSASAYSGLFSVIVTYASPDSAREARDTLHGQVYGSQALFVEVVSSGASGGQMGRLGIVQPSTASSGLDRHQQKRLTNATNRPSAFNPRASPFLFDSNSFTSSNSAPPTCTITGSRLDYFEPFASKNSVSISGLNHNNYDENIIPPSLSHSSSRSPIPMSTGLATPSETCKPQPLPLSSVSNTDWSLSSNTPRLPFLHAESHYPLRTSSAASWYFMFFCPVCYI